MIVVYNEATQRTFLKSGFVIFRCQKYVKKGYIEMTKKFYLETLKKCARSLHFTLLRLLKKWSLHGLKLHCQQFSPNTHFKIFSTHMNLVCFYQCVPKKTYHFTNKKCTGGLLNWDCRGQYKWRRCLWLAIQGLQNVWEVWRTFHVAIGHNKKVGYHLNCLKNRLKKLIETLVPKRGRLP